MSNNPAQTAMDLTATMADGRELKVQVRNPDLVRFDITRPKEGWPTAEEGPILMLTFVAWAAAKRTGLYDGKWEQWRDVDCVSLDEPEEVVTDPTRPTPGPTSPSALASPPAPPSIGG